MTERKWRIIESVSRKGFYEKIAKYEAEGYILLPESFSVSSRGNVFHYYALMTKQ